MTGCSRDLITNLITDLITDATFKLPLVAIGNKGRTTWL